MYPPLISPSCPSSSSSFRPHTSSPPDDGIVCLNDTPGSTPTAPVRPSYLARRDIFPSRLIIDSRSVTPVQDHTPSPPSSHSPATPWTYRREYPPSPSSPPGYSSLRRGSPSLQPIHLLSLPPSPYLDSDASTSILGAPPTFSPASYSSPQVAWTLPKNLNVTARNIVRQRSLTLLPSPCLPEPVSYPPPKPLRRLARNGTRKVRNAEPAMRWMATILLMVVVLAGAGCIVEYEKHWSLGLGEHGRGGLVVSWDGREGVSLDSILHDL